MPDVVNASAQVNPAGTSLRAFVSPETVNTNELKIQLGLNLPQYMVPDTIYCLPNLPLNVNGKTNHTLIRNTMDDLIIKANDLVLPPFMVSREPVLPTSIQETESQILEIWKDVLGTKNVSSSMTFFQAGGNRCVSCLSIFAFSDLMPKYYSC